MIRFEGVKKVYEGTGKSPDIVALHDVDLHIRKGEFVFVLGHSGAGKSTFLKLILREEVATEGSIEVNGVDLNSIRQRDIPYFRRQLGVVFQDFRLIPTMTAYENVAFAMRVTNIPERQIKRRVPYVLNLVGLGEKAHSLPQELSGGEQQRIALARALVHSPPIIIADEPTGNIDPELSVEIMELLLAINTVGTTVVVVTHERDLAMRFNKRIITIDHGEVVGDMPPPQRRRPAMAGAGAPRRMTAAQAPSPSRPSAPAGRSTASAEAGAQQGAPSRAPREGQAAQARPAAAAAAGQKRPAASAVHTAARPVQTGEGVDDLVQDILKKKQAAQPQRPSGQKGGGQA